MNIILHIGQSKTGTTALQSMLSRNRDVLAEHKILYPDMMLKGAPLRMLNHNPFANALGGYDFYPRLTAEEYWQQFTDQYKAGDYKTMLLSGESFLGGRPYMWELSDPEDYFKVYRHKLSALKTLLGGAQVTVLAYLRPQNQWLESAIPHIIRYEWTMGRKIYESDRQIMETLLPVMDYNRVIDLWEKIIIPISIKLKEYNRQKFPQQNVVLDFLEQIGLSDARLTESDPSDNVHDSWSRVSIQ